MVAQAADRLYPRVRDWSMRLLETVKYAAYIAMYGYVAYGWLPVLRMWYVRVRLFGWPSTEACRQAMAFDQHRVWNPFGGKREHATASALRVSPYAVVIGAIA